jgi:G2/mitotic-specific cyclin 3/4
MGLMLECCEEPKKHHQAIYEKYKDKRYKRSSVFVEGEIQAGFRMLHLAANAAATRFDYENEQQIAW